MPKKETSIYMLNDFLPIHTFEMVAPFFQDHNIHLTLTRERKSVLGDYRVPTKKTPHHRISLNINLNRYNFLITLLHELAHLLTWNKHGRNAAPHGIEWKNQFRAILLPFIDKSIFPNDIEKAIINYINNPSASTCTDPSLFKALYKYDEQRQGYKLVDEIPIGGLFEAENGRTFEKLQKLRTRNLCQELSSKRKYYFHGIIEVKHITKP